VGIDVKSPAPIGANALSAICSQGAQEIDDSLLLRNGQSIKPFDDLIGLASCALVSPDGVNEVGGTSIMKEEDALSGAPKRSGSEFIRACSALRDAISEALAHVVDDQVGPEVRRLVR
jgi:hypothetical protein